MHERMRFGAIFEEVTFAFAIQRAQDIARQPHMSISDLPLKLTVRKQNGVWAAAWEECSDTWIDRSEPTWPREVGQAHLDADADHPVEPNTDEQGDATNCMRDGCGLACTSNGRRHGFDT